MSGTETPAEPRPAFNLSIDDLPRGPSQDERGRFMRVDGTEFRTRDQLSRVNRDRLSKKGLKPIEIATFSDIQACNRDHLRTYCGVYELKRKEKGEMEKDMARYVAAWHYGEPGYDIADYQLAPVKKFGTPSGTPVSAGSRQNGARPPSTPQSSGQSTPAVGDKRAAPSPPSIDPSLLKTAAARPETRTIKRARPSGGSGAFRRKSAPSSQPVNRQISGMMASDAAAPHGAGGLGIGTVEPGHGLYVHSDGSQAHYSGPFEPTGSGVYSNGQSINPDDVRPTSIAAVGGTAHATSRGAVSHVLHPAVDLPAPTLQRSYTTGAGLPPRGLQGATPYGPQKMIPVQAPRTAAKPVSSPANNFALNSAASTSFKQYAHAQQAAARYKAAYNGAGAAIVQVVENAASYFEGRDTGEAILNKKHCLERYQFNVDMLNQIFDGPPLKGGEGQVSGMAESSDRVDTTEVTPPNGVSANDDGDVRMSGITPEKIPKGEVRDSEATTNASSSEADVRRTSLTESVLQRLAEGMCGRSDSERLTALQQMDGEFESLLGRDPGIDKMHVRAVQALDRAKTAEDVEKVRNDFEKEHNIRFVDSGSAIVKRELDRNAPLYVPPSHLRILKFG